MISQAESVRDQKLMHDTYALRGALTRHAVFGPAELNSHAIGMKVSQMLK